VTWLLRQLRNGQIVPAAVTLLVVAGCASVVRTSPFLPDPKSSALAVAPSAAGTPQPTPITVAGARHIPRSGAIEPGRYFVAKGPWTPATFSFTMPAGWIAENGGQSISKHANDSGREVGFSVVIVDRIYADPCGANDTIELGPTADDLGAGLLALPGVEARGPFQVTVGGRPGQHLELTAAADIDLDVCDPPIGLQIWLDRSGNKYFVLGHIPARVYIVDVAGGRLVLVGTSSFNRTAAPADIAEVEAIFASIEFEP
jgi:hypothetical protein